MGGKNGSSYSNEVWLSQNGSDWEQVNSAEWGSRAYAHVASLNAKLYLFSGDDGNKKNDVYLFNYPTTGTHADYFTFKEGDASFKHQKDSLRLFSGNDALHFHCVGSGACYVSKNTNEGANILYFTANSNSIEPGFNLDAQNLSSVTGGVTLTDETIVHINHSTVSGAKIGRAHV